MELIVSALRQGPQVRNTPRAATAAHGQQGLLDVRPFPRIVGLLKQLDEIGGLRILANDTDGLYGRAANPGTVIVKARHNGRKSLADLPLAGQLDESLFQLVFRLWQASQQVGIHVFARQSDQRFHGCLFQLSIILGHGLQQDRHA